MMMPMTELMTREETVMHRTWQRMTIPRTKRPLKQTMQMRTSTVKLMMKQTISMAKKRTRLLKHHTARKRRRMTLGKF